MTTVYFAQHGVAESKDIDESRPLAKTGADETKKVATHLSKHGIVVHDIFHSGKLRAQQTATIFAEALNVGRVSELKGMNPNDDPAILIDKLSIDGAMYVGHLPHIQKVVSKIVSNDENSAVIAFQNSAVACIEMENHKGMLDWFITPSLCEE